MHMNKKMIFGFLGVVVLAVISTAMIFMNKTNQKIGSASRAETVTNPIPTTPVRAMNKQTALKEYSDPSGYRFLYPSTFSVVAELNEADPDLYSSLKIKPAAGSDYISIKVITSNFTKLDDWARANKLSASDIKRLKLADLEAYQAPIQKQIVTAALDAGVAFTLVMVNSDNRELMNAYDTIIKNFSFYQPAEAPAEKPQEAAPAPEVSDESSEEVIE